MGRAPYVYQVLEWGTGVRSDDDADARYVTIAGVAKTNTRDSSYAVANEFICARLGTVIGLPIPPGAIVRAHDGGLGFVSLRFGDHNERPPPVHPPEFAREWPEIAAGVIAFDCWIRHADRHAENLAFSRHGIPPAVFDHDRALFGRRIAAGDAYLSTNVDDPCVRPACLRPHFEGLKGYLESWWKVIAAVPHEVIWAVCDQARQAGALTSDDGNAAYTFLVERKSNVANWLSIGVTDDEQLPSEDAR